MFHYEYPVFLKKRLLRVEMLEQLRDYPQNYLQLHFHGYSDGIVCGCQISWDNEQLEIAPGILYHGGKLYFMQKPYRMVCCAEDKERYLKVQFITEVHEEGKIEGNTRIVLDDRKADAACEMELCRFRLQEGARLRDTYINFEDYETEFDTINRIHVPFASYGQATIWSEILICFAEEILQTKNNNVYDINFAMNILANQGILPAKCINSYLRVRLDERKIEDGNYSIYQGLRDLLGQEKTGTPVESGKKVEQHSVMLW